MPLRQHTSLAPAIPLIDVLLLADRDVPYAQKHSAPSIHRQIQRELACGAHFIPQSRASANRAGFSVWFCRGVVMTGSVPEAVQLADMQRL